VDEIRAVVQAVAPKPVNLIVSNPIGLTVAEVADLGVRRISLGSGLARAAWGAFMRSAEGLVQGHFEPLGDSRPFAEINGFFRNDLKTRA
jgi:2-methylisocitrate lyase-like PEP mutase family enzyme